MDEGTTTNALEPFFHCADCHHQILSYQTADRIRSDWLSPVDVEKTF
jgi:hypothetical protein